MRVFICGLLVLVGSVLVFAQEEPVFSGPQPGESLSAFALTGVLGGPADSNIDLIELSKNGPLLIVFVHERTRPAFALTNALLKFAGTRKDQGLTAGMVFLSADPTETRTWLNNVKQHMPTDALIGISPDGKEGPGNYGLNRNVTLTIVIADKGKVTSSFALVQPGLDVDGPKILRAIAAVTGGGEIPSISQLTPEARMTERGSPSSQRPVNDSQDPNLRPLLSRLISRTATPEQVDAAAKAVIEYADRNPAARKQIAEIANRIIAAKKMQDYGTKPAQDYLTKWASEFSTGAARP